MPHSLCHVGSYARSVQIPQILTCKKRKEKEKKELTATIFKIRTKFSMKICNFSLTITTM